LVLAVGCWCSFRFATVNDFNHCYFIACWLLADLAVVVLLAVGCLAVLTFGTIWLIWLLAVGCCCLAVSCWLLAVGCWLLAVGCIVC
jgi:hypothetical protein